VSRIIEEQCAKLYFPSIVYLTVLLLTLEFIGTIVERLALKSPDCAGTIEYQ
jgi:hypothetical protein